MEFIQLVGVKVQVITLKGSEDSNATEEVNCLLLVLGKLFWKAMGKEIIFHRPQKVIFNVIVTRMVERFSNTRY